MNHKCYVDVFNRNVPQHIVNGSLIRSKHNKLFTMRYRKRALLLFDKKRYWVTPYKSLAFSHPDIPVVTKNNCNSSKRKVNDTSFSYEGVVRLNHKKLKSCNIFK